MPATFVVEDGSGKPDANSYVTLAEADQYVEDHGAEATWTAADQAAKEEALRLGTQFVDLKFGGRFVGYKARRENALSWPRYSAVDEDGYAYDGTEIPPAVKYAAVEAALRHLAGDDLLGAVAHPGDVAAESVSVGPISESLQYVGGKSQVPYYPKIAYLLRRIVVAGDVMARG